MFFRKRSFLSLIGTVSRLDVHAFFISLTLPVGNMRTTHAFGDPASGLMGFHKGTTFAHVLTWGPNGILPDYEALQSDSGFGEILIVAWQRF